MLPRFLCDVLSELAFSSLGQGLLPCGPSVEIKPLYIIHTCYALSFFRNLERKGQPPSSSSHLGEADDICALRAAGPLPTPTHIRDCALSIPSWFHEARVYRGVLLRPLCTTHPDRSGAKPRFSYVFYSLFDCDTRLKMVHVGFHPAAKSALEQERVAKEEERRQQQQLCGRHRAAVLGVLQTLPKLRQHLLSHFKRYLRDCYTSSSASQAVANVGRYLAGRSIYLEKADGRTEVSRCSASVASRILIAQLRNQVQGIEAETSMRQSGSYGPELRSLAEQLELSLMVEAYAEVWETSERPWPGVL